MAKKKIDKEVKEPFFKCPYCNFSADENDKENFEVHVSNHVADQIKAKYPDVVKAIETIEAEFSVKVLIKVDVAGVVITDKISDKLIDSIENENESAGTVDGGGNGS